MLGKLGNGQWTLTCTKLDPYMRNLCHNEMVMSWQITLTDGTTVYGDYEREGYDNPWIRLTNHCEKYDVLPTKVQLYMFGAEQKVFFEDEKGLDGISIVRGAAQDQAIDGSHSTSYQTLAVSLLREDCSAIDVVKYIWPHNEFEQLFTARELCEENLKKMIFKHGSQKRNNPQVQKYLDGTAV